MDWTVAADSLKISDKLLKSTSDNNEKKAAKLIMRLHLEKIDCFPIVKNKDYTLMILFFGEQAFFILLSFETNCNNSPFSFFAVNCEFTAGITFNTVLYIFKTHMGT